jgi:hypothetical protein
VPAFLVALGRSGGRGLPHRMNVWKATAVKITLDSTEPLEDALRVLGAMYDVNLVVSREQDATKPVENVATKASTTHGRTRKRLSGSTKPRSAAVNPAAGSGRSKSRSASGGGGRPSNAEVRAWARENGLAVSDHGRLAGSVLAAYRSENRK